MTYRSTKTLHDVVISHQREWDTSVHRVYSPTGDPQQPELRRIVPLTWKWNEWKAFWVILRGSDVRDAVLVLNSAGFIKAAVELGPSPGAKTSSTAPTGGEMSVYIRVLVRSFSHSFIHLWKVLACSSLFSYTIIQSFTCSFIHPYIHLLSFIC